MMMLFILPLAFFVMGFSTFGPDIGDMHRNDSYNLPMPRGNSFHVCKRDCINGEKFKVSYSGKDIAFLKELMHSNSAKRERENIARSVTWMLRRAGETGGSCTGFALAVTSHLLVLQANGLLKYHTVHRPIGRIVFPPHWAGAVQSRAGAVWAVDAYLARPRVLIQPESRWYRR